MKCQEGAVRLIDQIVETIQLVTDEEYYRPLEVYNGSTLGKHFRHIFDFFNCLVIQSVNSDVDYCLRERDTDLEINRAYATRKFNELKKELNLLDENKAIIVHADFELEGGNRPIVKTTIGREIMYGYDHAVHHMAIVKIGMKAINPDLYLTADLGVAASTMRHQQAHSYDG